MANLIPPLQSQTTGVPAQANDGHREASDDYMGALLKLNDKNRVIICSRGIQYILQRRYADGFRGATWKPLSHHATRKSLRQACERLGLLSEPSAPHAIDDLPEHARHLAMIAPKGGTTTQ